MKKILFILTICLVGSISVFSQSKRTWEETQSVNTIAAYKEFLRTNPKSNRTIEAQESLNWLLTVRSDSVKNYQRFIEKYPLSKNAIVCKDFIDKNLTIEEINLIDLMIDVWCIWKYDNYKKQNTLVTNASKLMVIFTGTLGVKVNLNSNSYSNKLKKKFKGLDGTSCDYDLKNLEYSYDISQANINENSEFKCIITSKQKHQLSIVKGGYKFKNGEALMNDSSVVTIDNRKFKLTSKKWINIE